ncbi:MAG: 2Fe-2S iron-sulfur cluster-binding protein [Desulforhabdus sp.]|jgi:NADH dehydrogenase/NADH:ubiquinone oxidoreductase subunit G|nr:2Fe-2S iron-sulfur cluster-binding protein [Desulforhabdus sp.]
MIRISVDGKQIEVDEQQSLLAACLREGIYIPNLCFLEEMKDPPASCRLCFVDIEGERSPVAACKAQPREAMVVKTDTDRVRRLQRSALRLLLSVHNVDCRNCPSNKQCDLQRLSKFLGVPLKSKKLEHLERGAPVDLDHPLFEFVPDRCILCAKCIHVCRQRNDSSLLTFAKRGFETVVTCFDAGDSAGLSCKECRGCVEICPVSAIFLKDAPSTQSESIS